MKTNLQPMLNEMKLAATNANTPRTEVNKICSILYHRNVQADLGKHWADVEKGLTTEYVQL